MNRLQKYVILFFEIYKYNNFLVLKLCIYEHKYIYILELFMVLEKK